MTEQQLPTTSNNSLSTTQKRHTASVLGVKVDMVTLDELIDTIDKFVKQRQRSIVANVNVHALNLAYMLPWFRDFLNQCPLVFCDGFGVKWGARILGYDIPERFTPPDWLPLLAQRCAEKNYSIYLLGAQPGIAELAGRTLQSAHQNLRIVGSYHGHFDHTLGSDDSEAVIQAINELDPDILLVGFGMPLQEKWLRDNWQRLEVRVALPVGAAFDFLSGNVSRGPRWATDHGLEWLTRLLTEPRRLWRRYIIGNPRFLLRVLRERFSVGTRRTLSH
jgi:N-acetylglucosaminyldiphosphoundecaprenol N-acetyl-beta-D-mannosaminyltransferase